MKAKFYHGGSFSDERGNLRFVNDEISCAYRRFYLITPVSTQVVRAWQGHKREKKVFYAINGSFLIAVVNPSSFENPDDDELPEFYELSDHNNGLLIVPEGCYTGIKSKTKNATLLVLSEFDLNESKSDDYRQPAQRWVNWDSID